MIEAIFEIIFGFIAELVLEFIAEAFIELGFESVAAKFSNRTRSRIFAFFLYGIAGMILGGLSVYFFPKIEFANPLIPTLYFIVSPIIAGVSLSIVSYFIVRDTRPVSWFEWDKFLCGVLFAGMYALSRVFLG